MGFFFSQKLGQIEAIVRVNATQGKILQNIGKHFIVWVEKKRSLRMKSKMKKERKEKGKLKKIYKLTGAILNQIKGIQINQQVQLKNNKLNDF